MSLKLRLSQQRDGIWSSAVCVYLVSLAAQTGCIPVRGRRVAEASKVVGAVSIQCTHKLGYGAVVVGYKSSAQGFPLAMCPAGSC